MNSHLEEWLSFVTAESHVLHEAPQLVFQQAVNQPDSSIPARAAEQYAKSKSLVRPWVRWVNKPNETTDRIATLVTGASTSSCAYSPDGKQLVSGSAGKLRIWDTRDGAEIAALQVFPNPDFAPSISACMFSPNGKQILYGSWDYALHIWDAEALVQLAVLYGHRHYVLSCAYSPDGSYIASGSWDASLKVWEVATRKEVATVSHGMGHVKACAWSPDGSRIAYGSGSKLRLWDFASRTEGFCVNEDREVSGCAWSPDGTMVVSASYGQLRAWNATTGELVKRFGEQCDFLTCCAFSPDGKKIAAGTSDSLLRIWDVNSGSEFALLAGHSDAVLGCQFSPDGSQIASASGDGTVGIWKTNGKVAGSKGSPPKHGARIKCCAYSPSRREILTGSDDGKLTLCRADTTEVIRSFTAHPWSVSKCSFHPDGDKALSCSSRQVKIWDVEFANEVANLDGFLDEVSTIYSPNGDQILSASWTEGIKIWDAKTYVEIAKVKTDENIYSCTYSRDGNQFAIASINKLIVCDSKSGERVAELTEQYALMKNCLWSPDGKQIVSGSGDNTLRIWDPSSGELLRKIPASNREIVPHSYSLDGSRILTKEGAYSSDSVYRVWDADSGTLIATMPGRSRQFTQSCFTPDGNFVCSPVSDNTLSIWDATTGAESHRFFFPARVMCFVCISDSLIYAGDYGGGVYLLQLCNHLRST